MKKILVKTLLLFLLFLPAHAGEDKEEAFAFNGISNIFEIIKAVFNTNIAIDDGIVMAPAKDLCSCIFLVGQPEKFCLDNHEQYNQFRNIGIFDGWIRPAKIDYERRTVTLENRHHLAVATYRDAKLGCKITRMRTKLRGVELLPLEERTPASKTKKR
jgi:hypothetical protein